MLTLLRLSDGETIFDIESHINHFYNGARYLDIKGSLNIYGHLKRTQPQTIFKVDLTGQEVLMQFENPVLNLWRLFIIDVLDNRDAY